MYLSSLVESRLLQLQNPLGYNAHLEQGRSGMIQLDAAGRIVSINRTAAQICSLEKGAVLGQRAELVFQAYGERILRVFDLTNQEEVHHVNIRVNGRNMCLEIDRLLLAGEDRPAGMVIIINDVSASYAAIKQLQVVGESIGVPVFEMGQTNPVEIAKEAIKLAKDHGYDYVFLDTAGRLHIDEELMTELKNIKAEVKPHEILLVVDAMTGQDAVNVATSFNDALGIDGIVLTKLDGDTRGGAALSTRAVTGKPIKFVGVGEKLTDLDTFHPDRMASRILGMGDMLSLIEKAEMALDEKKAMELEKRLKQNKFDMNDLLDQLAQIRRMGSIKDTLSLIPGVEKQIKDIDIDERQYDRVRAIIESMTPQEREKPEIINPSRKKRIAAGWGQDVEAVNKLLTQHKQMQKMFKQMNGKGKKRRRGRPDLSQLKGFNI